MGGRVVYNVAKAMCESESKSVKEEAKGKVKMKERVNNWGKKDDCTQFWQGNGSSHMCASEGKIMKSRWKESKSKSENEGDSDFGLKIGKKDNCVLCCQGNWCFQLYERGSKSKKWKKK